MFLSTRSAPTALPAFLRHTGTVHELRAPPDTATHLGLAVRMLAGLPAHVPVLWVSITADWYPPGLAWAGLDPARCLFACVRDDDEALGAAEVALRGGMATAAACGGLGRLAAKRLALAAKRGDALGILLRHAPAQTTQDSTAFASRWFVTSAPGGILMAELLYAKGAMPSVYMIPPEGGDVRAPLAVPSLRQAG